MVAQSTVTRDVGSALASGDRDTKLQAVRAVKNDIIGNKRKKRELLHAIPGLVDILASTSDRELLVQSAAAIGSFSFGTDEGVKLVVQHNGAAHLITALSSADEKVVEAAIRSLKLLYQSPLAPHEPLQAPAALHKLVQLLSSAKPAVADVAAGVLARCCSTHQEQCAVTEAGGVRALLPMLSSHRNSTQMAALEALAALTTGNSRACLELMQPDCVAVVDQLLGLGKQRAPRTRLLCAACITNLCEAATDRELSTQCLQKLAAARRALLPRLVRLLGEPGVKEEVPFVLARLVGDSAELLKAAADADAVRLLASFLSDASCSRRLRQGALQALGVLCLEREEARQQFVEAKVLPAIVAGLTDAEPGMRSAATLCVRALSRSAKNLRANVVDAEVAAPLCRLLSDPNSEVQVHAAAAMCNLVLEFSSVKGALLSNEVIRQLVPLASSMVPELRLNAVWALKNLTHDCGESVHAALVQELPWGVVRSLMADCEAGVREQAVALLQNLCKGGEANIQRLVAWSQGDLLRVLEEQLEPHAAPATLLSRALYTVSNICTGGEAHKDAVVSSNIPMLLVHHLQDDAAPLEVRLPAVWCIINLLWQGNGSDPSSRCRALRGLGMEEVLRFLQEDASQDLRGLVQTALEHLRR